MNIGKVDDLRGLLKFLEERGKKLGIELSPSAKTWVKSEEGGEKSEDLEKLKEEMAKYDKFKGKTVEAIREEVCKKLKQKLETVQSEKAKQMFNTAYGVVCEKKTYAEIGIDRSRGDWRVFIVLLSMGVTNLSILEQLLPQDSKVFVPKWDKYLLHTLKKAWDFAKPALEFQAKAHGKSEREVKKLAKSIITNAILTRFRIKTFYNTTGHNQAIVSVFVWSKKRGIYAPFDKGLRKVIRRMAELLEIRSMEKTLAQLSKRDVDDIFDEIKDLTLTPLPKEPLRVAFANGTLEWTDKILIWHKERSPKLYSFYYLPWEVNVEEINKFLMQEITIQDLEDLARRVCPKSLETFKSWVDDKWPLLFEIIGYTLYPEIRFRKAFMLIGSGRNGKSTFINLIKKILGEYAVNISPRELFDPRNRFVVANLYHKLVNAVAESKDYTIEDMDRFKRLTGGDWLTADVKFKDPITFKSTAKIIVASNNMPHLRDTNDKAFWHRWVIIEFPHEFKDNDAWFDQVFNNKEINGIVTTSIVALLRVFRQEHFDFEQSEQKVMDIWLSHIDSVYSFIKTYSQKGVITVDPKNADLWVKRSDLYKLYRNYCIDQGFRGVGKKSFARKLREYFSITTVMKNIDGERVRAFVGIAVDHIEMYNELTKHEVKINEIPGFIEYVKQNHDAVKEFAEIIRDFGNDREKANKFVAWCESKRFCTRITWDTIRISLS